MFRPDAEEPATNYVTPLTDISANIFAMMVLILILALAGQQNSVRESSRNVLSEKDLNIVERKAMTPVELVQHLYDRRGGAGPVRIDVLEMGIAIVSPDGKEIKFEGPDIGSVLRQPPRAGAPPVRLYVFSHRWYDETVRSLLSTNRQWVEISVPQALQADDQTSWSEDFANLLSRPVNLEEFRTALAQLLASKDPQSKANGERQPKLSPLSDISASSAGTYETLFERITKWLRRAITALALLAAFSFIWWVERKARSES